MGSKRKKKYTGFLTFVIAAAANNFGADFSILFITFVVSVPSQLSSTDNLFELMPPSTDFVGCLRPKRLEV